MDNHQQIEKLVEKVEGVIEEGASLARTGAMLHHHFGSAAPQSEKTAKDFAKQILFGNDLYLKAGEEFENEKWHQVNRQYEAYQAGKNDVRATYFPLEEVEK